MYNAQATISYVLEGLQGCQLQLDNWKPCEEVSLGGLCIACKACVLKSKGKGGLCGLCGIGFCTDRTDRTGQCPEQE